MGNEPKKKKSCTYNEEHFYGWFVCHLKTECVAGANNELIFIPGLPGGSRGS